MPIQIDSLPIFEYLTWLNSMGIFGFSIFACAKNKKVESFLKGFNYNPYPHVYKEIINIPFNNLLLLIGAIVFYIKSKLIIINTYISVTIDLLILFYLPLKFIFLVIALVSLTYAFIKKEHLKHIKNHNLSYLFFYVSFGLRYFIYIILYYIY